MLYTVRFRVSVFLTVSFSTNFVFLTVSFSIIFNRFQLIFKYYVSIRLPLR